MPKTAAYNSYKKNQGRGGDDISGLPEEEEESVSNNDRSEVSKGGYKWEMRGLEEKNVTEENLNKFFEGKFEDADPHVQQLFLFAYCDCPLSMMDKVPRAHAGAKITVKSYLKKLPEIRSAMIRVVMLMSGKKKADPDQENQENQPLGEGGDGADDGNGTQKSKGGRPKAGWNFEVDMQPYYNKYRSIEFKNREADDNSDPMTWYKVAVEEMERMTAPSPLTSTVVTYTRTTTEQQEGQAGGSQNQEQDEESWGFNNDFYEKINNRVAV